MRGPGQVYVPPGPPSTSGRSHTTEAEEDSDERFLQHSVFKAPTDSGLHPDMRLHGRVVPDDLLFKENDRFVPLRSAFASANYGTFTIGKLENGYVLPIYNQNHKMVIIDDRDKSVIEISPEEADSLGINKHISEERSSLRLNRPSPSTNSKPPRPPKNRLKNQRKPN